MNYATLPPDPGDPGAAETALAIGQVQGGDGEDVALDDRLLAVGAPGRLRAFQAGHVADIHVVQPLAAGGVARLHERLDGRRREVLQLVLRMEAREVQRLVRSQLLGDPGAHAADGATLSV